MVLQREPTSNPPFPAYLVADSILPTSRHCEDRRRHRDFDRREHFTTCAILTHNRCFAATKIGKGSHMQFHHPTRPRVQLAQRLLLTTEGSMGQISLICGMCDQADLTRVFQ